MLNNRIGPLFESPLYSDTKDPCPIFDGKVWHIFGSGGSSSVEIWKILHATAPTLLGPWTMESPALLHGLKGPHVAAPGVIMDLKENIIHMFVQSDFLDLGGNVYHLVSDDFGKSFCYTDTSIMSLSNTAEAGIYDPHPAIIKGQKYISYSGTPVVEHYPTHNVARPDIYLARSKSNTWNGPWERLGMILKHEDIHHHNQHNHPDYEWGLEGSQLLQLPNGKVLMNAVCFLPDGARGTRQRVFFAIANEIMGPYKSLGPILKPTNFGWESGENGHAAGIIDKNLLHLFYQARSKENGWRYGIAQFDLKLLMIHSEKLVSL